MNGNDKILEQLTKIAQSLETISKEGIRVYQVQI